MQIASFESFFMSFQKLSDRKLFLNGFQVVDELIIWWLVGDIK